ncbi:MAG: ribonuclease III [bacterium]|nr:MAG: ribonuclease III [bacterium]
MADARHNLSVLESRIHYTFEDPAYLEQALTHPSAVKEGRSRGPDNQRLEFLGDAVLQLVISDLLMRHFPDQDQGHLSFMRAELVRKEHLAVLADRLGLMDFLRIGPGLEAAENVAFKSVTADALEAVLGAVFLDGGWESARAVTEKVVGELPEPAEDIKGPKSVLQEIIQKRFEGDVPEYRVRENPGDRAERRFRAMVYHRKRLLGSGEGRSKKKAEEAAAQEALNRMRGEGS